MLPIAIYPTSLLGAAKTALKEGAYQSADIRIYDVTATGKPTLIILGNADIIAGSLTVSKDAISGDNLEIGAMISDELRLSVRRVTNGTDALADLAMLGQEITVEISWEVPYGTSTRTATCGVFRGVVTELSRTQGNVYNIVALDGMIVFDQPFKAAELKDPSDPSQPLYFGPGAPVTVYNLFRSIVISKGAPYVDTLNVAVATGTTLHNQNENITVVPENMGYTYRQVLRWCAQIMGVNVKIDAGAATSIIKLFTKTDASEFITRGKCYSALPGERMDDKAADETRYGIVIRSGAEDLFNGAAYYGRRLEITDNVLITANGLNAQSIGNSLYLLTSTDIPAYTISFKGKTLPMWYAEPWDLFTTDMGGNLLPTKIRYRLNGGTEISTDVGSAASNKFSGVTAFSTQQQASLSAQLDPLSEGLKDAENNIGTVAAGLTQAQTDIGTISGTISTINGNISTINRELGTVVDSVQGLLTDVNGLQNAMYYKAGDTFSMGPPDSVSGYLTSSGKTANFTVYLDKSVKNISTITINRLVGGIRTADQGYANGSDGTNPEKTNWLSVSQTSGSGIEVSVSKVTNSDRRLSLVIKNSNGFVTATASSGNNDIRNSPVSFAAVGHAQAFMITFN